MHIEGVGEARQQVLRLSETCAVGDHLFALGLELADRLADHHGLARTHADQLVQVEHSQKDAVVCGRLLQGSGDLAELHLSGRVRREKIGQRVHGAALIDQKAFRVDQQRRAFRYPGRVICEQGGDRNQEKQNEQCIQREVPGSGDASAEAT